MGYLPRPRSLLAASPDWWRLSQADRAIFFEMPHSTTAVRDTCPTQSTIKSTNVEAAYVVSTSPLSRPEMAHLGPLSGGPPHGTGLLARGRGRSRRYKLIAACLRACNSIRAIFLAHSSAARRASLSACNVAATWLRGRNLRAWSARAAKSALMPSHTAAEILLTSSAIASNTAPRFESACSIIPISTWPWEEAPICFCRSPACRATGPFVVTQFAAACHSPPAFMRGGPLSVRGSGRAGREDGRGASDCF